VLAACIPNAGNQAPGKPDAGKQAPAASTGFCVKPAATCNPDPGASPVDCTAAEAGLEFFPFPIADFEHWNDNAIDPNQPDIKKGYVGQFMYSYTDATAQIYANRDGTQAPVGYEPIATSANVCTTDSGNHVLHATGGPFLGWGGGLGVAMAHLNQDSGLCPLAEIAHPREYCPSADAEVAIIGTTLNMSQWDGVAVWARRAPDSQPLLRVLVGNKYVDEDINYQQQRNGDPPSKRYCERVRECACVNGKACSLWGASDAGAQGGGDAGAGSYYCGDPAADPPPGTISGNGIVATNSCNTTHCNEVYPAYPQDGNDPQFISRPCAPYAFRSGFESSYCWDPDPNNRYLNGRLDPNGIPDSPPAESDQQCGDYWTFPLHLTTEWQLFLVPFTTMFQQGWAKRWPFFDTTSVSVVRLTWDAGWVDYWIDNLRFYRVRR
jgi:hypothetical protein